jgi:hypothetical protein
MQIKTTLRFHLIRIRMVIIRNTIKNKCWQVYGKKRTLIHCSWGCKLVQSKWKVVWKLLKKDLTIDLT